MIETSGSFSRSMVEKLSTNEKYRAIIDALDDDAIKKQVDLTVKAFITELATAFEKIDELEKSGDKNAGEGS